VSNLYVAWDADHAGRQIGQARLNDQPEELRRISNLIDSGNKIFEAWAVEHGGSMVSCGGDEGVVEVNPKALQDLPKVKEKYENLLQLTVSIGIGVKMSMAFEALMASKLRGRNRITFYDKEVQKEIDQAKTGEDDGKKKIVDEYLAKHQPIHHTGEGGSQERQQEKSSNPEIQAQHYIDEMPEVPEVPEDKSFEDHFRDIASDQEKKDQALKASKSKDLNAIKQKVATALQAVHKQLPVLAQIKQASPDTYSAVLGVVQGLIAMGRQLSDTDQQLAKAIGSNKVWVGGGSRIPAINTPERKTWDNNYKQAVANYFTEGKPHLLKEIQVPVAKLLRNHMVVGNEPKTRLYHRMVAAGDKMPPMVVSKERGGYRVIDGNRRLDVALANGLTHVDALVPMTRSELTKGQVNIYHNTNLPPAGMLATSEGGLCTYDLGMDKSDLISGGAAQGMSPEQFDQEQLAIGTSIELQEHTDDEELAREIAMDHLAEDPDYYRDEIAEETEESSDKPEPLEKMALIHNDPKNPLVVYRVQNEKGEGPYSGEIFDTAFQATSGKPFSEIPGPMVDFTSKERENESPRWRTGLDPALRFAFETPQHAVDWFGEKGIKQLTDKGYPITPVKAKKVFRGKSGKQVMFIPHESEKALLMAKSDWDMSEDKEELDPSAPVPNNKVLNKDAVPEHIKSIRAHHNLVPGEVLDSRHIVVSTPSGKNAVREVASGMVRDLSDTVSNPIGPGQGNPTSARNKPSRGAK
jgi:hypothetical protein